MRFFMRIIIPLAVALVLSSAAFAGPIVGSMGLSFLTPTMGGGTDLSNVTFVGDGPFTLRDVTGGCPLDSGDYCVVPTATNFGAFTLTLAGIAGGGGVVMTDGIYGGFTATFGEVVSRTAGFLDVYLEGTYSGLPSNGTTCGGSCDANSPTSFRASWTFTGASLSGSGTLASPPVPPVPEPATLFLLGSALLGVGFIRRRNA